MTTRSSRPAEPLRSRLAGVAFFGAFLAVCLAFGSGITFAQTTIVNDTFANATNNGGAGGVTSAINWYGVGAGATTSVVTNTSSPNANTTVWPEGVSANSLFLSPNNNGNSSLVGVLPNTYTLAQPGDNLTLTFDVAFNNLSDPSDLNSNTAGFRFGLYNSNGTNPTGDKTGVTNDDYGYSARMQTGPSTGTGAISFVSQTSQSSGNNVLAGSATTLASGAITGSPSIISGASGGTTYYVLQLSITYATGGVLDFTVSEATPNTTNGTENSLTQIYSVNTGGAALVATSFNEIALGGGYASPNLPPNFQIDNVDLTESLAAVPEPSSVGILIAGAGTLLFARRRKA